MICINCNEELEENTLYCQHCSINWALFAWKEVAVVTSTAEQMIMNLFDLYGIPSQILRKSIDQFPFSFGPMGEAIIKVPEPYYELAMDIINSKDQIN